MPLYLQSPLPREAGLPVPICRVDVGLMFEVAVTVGVGAGLGLDPLCKDSVTEGAVYAGGTRSQQAQWHVLDVSATMVRTTHLFPVSFVVSCCFAFLC